MRIEDTVLNLIDLEKPDNRYIFFESLNTESRVLIYFDFGIKDELKIGRSLDADIRFQDITISRSHCSIQIAGEDAYIRDNSSKFGTLIMLRDRIELIDRKKLAIQVNKVFILIVLNEFCYKLLRCIK